MGKRYLLKLDISDFFGSICFEQVHSTAYPNAKVLYPGKEDFTPERRVEIFHRMKNNDWDAIILSHEQFGMIPQSPFSTFAPFRV